MQRIVVQLINENIDKKKPIITNISRLLIIGKGDEVFEKVVKALEREIRIADAEERRINREEKSRHSHPHRRRIDNV